MKQSSTLGPAAFGPVNAVGKQLSSSRASAPESKFGTADRKAVEKMFFKGVEYAPKDVPGPIYDLPSKKGKASFGFGKSTRSQVGKLYMPGMTV